MKTKKIAPKVVQLLQSAKEPQPQPQLERKPQIPTQPQPQREPEFDVCCTLQRRKRGPESQWPHQQKPQFFFHLTQQQQQHRNHHLSP